MGIEPSSPFEANKADLTRSLLAPPQQQQQEARRHSTLLLSAALAVKLALVLAMAVCLAGAGAYVAASASGGPHSWVALLLGGLGQQPFCRKSTSLAVLPAPGRVAAAQGNASVATGAGLQLVLWSGIGKHKAMFADLFSFDLDSRRWRKLANSCSGFGCEKMHHGVPTKWGRWKSGNAQVVADGLTVVGGDSYLPGTRRHIYTNDIWRLGWPSRVWGQAQVDPNAPMPAPRRGQSTMLYKDAEGVDHILLFGGRTQDKSLLTEVWDVALAWPRARWDLLMPPHDPPGAPAARRGHSATLVHGKEGPQMLIYGGREDLYYYGDMWLLDIKKREWREVQYQGEVVAPGRDHHSAALFRGKLFVFGGHSGEDYYHASPMNDLWAFDLASRTWEEVQQSGPKPLPRFEESYAQYAPPGSTEASKLLVFGGQTSDVCQLNDVWELDLKTLTWTELSPPHFCTKHCQREFGGHWRMKLDRKKE